MACKMAVSTGLQMVPVSAVSTDLQRVGILVAWKDDETAE